MGPFGSGKGSVEDRLAIFFGDVTNSEAEYFGILKCLEHACIGLSRDTCFRVGSLLVAKQLRGQWACRSESLQPLYTQCLRRLERLRAHIQQHSVQIEHVYREFNADADGTANESIDSFQPQAHTNGIVINENWRPHHSPNLAGQDLGGLMI